MSASRVPSGLALLEGCPAEPHVRWMVEHSVAGSPQAEVSELSAHVVAGNDPELIALYLHRWTQGPDAVVEVAGWEIGPSDRVIVTYRAAGGLDAELSFAIAEDGRLADRRHRRRASEAEITSCRTRELTDDQRAGIANVFATAYLDPDHRHLALALENDHGVGIATDPSGRTLAFTLYGWQEVDLPGLGRCGVGLPGLSCVDPGVRRGGLADATSVAAGMAGVQGPLDLAIGRLATPASLQWVLRSLPLMTWPTADDPWALYDHPTHTQEAVAARLVELVGGHGYYSGVCRGPGRPIGTPVVEPDVDASIRARFQSVDRGRGDTLVWLAWMTSPPPAWFQ